MPRDLDIDELSKILSTVKPIADETPEAIAILMRTNPILFAVKSKNIARIDKIHKDYKIYNKVL